MATDTISQQVYDTLVGKDFDPNALDNMGKSVDSPMDADMFSFEFQTPNKNYGTVVILISDNDMEVYFGDNLGKSMEAEDKKAWYDFLYLLRQLAKRNMYTFSLNNMNKLKYNMRSIAAITEGNLLEGYYGTSKTSYSDQPLETKLIIKHSKPIGEDDARFRNVQTLFIQTNEGERFKLPFSSLTGGKAMARHVAEGGNPYDAFGQHITTMMSELATLGKFVRASRNQTYGSDAQSLVEAAVEHYKSLKRKVKKIIGRRGYQEEIDNYDPITVTDLEETVDKVREIFVKQSLDPRVENALPILARLQEMNEVNEFEKWANSIVEGTWTVPKTPEQIIDLKALMSEPLPVGPDATNATEMLYDILGDDQLFDDLEELAQQDANADARPIIQNRLKELNININFEQNESALKENPTDEEPDTHALVTPSYKNKETTYEAKVGEVCDCCNNKIDKDGKCGCGPECKHCAGQHDIEEVVDIDTGKQALKAERDPMLEDELARLLQLAK